MKRTLPVIITFSVGILIIISYFVPHPPFGNLEEEMQSWFMIIAGFSIILGQLNLLKVNIIKIKRKSENWGYNVVAVSALAVMALSGIFWGMKEGPFDFMFNYVFEPLSATMFSLLAFFVASAAYRAFKARSTESTVLLIAAIIVMLGRASIGSLIPYVPETTEWIMNIPNMAGQRAIMICTGLGIVGSSMRVLLGIERSYLGSGE